VKRFSTASDLHSVSVVTWVVCGVVRGDIDTRGDAVDDQGVGGTDAGIHTLRNEDRDE
jgi:hypothetical protein